MQHEVFEHDLNGAKGLVVHVPGSPVFSMTFRFNSGYHYTDFKHYELPHVLEHLVAGGSSRNYPKHSQLSIEIEKNGAYHNAHTNPGSNWYVFECAAFERDRLIDLLPEYFLEQLFLEEDLEVEIGNVEQELARNITDHGRQCSNLYFERAYPEFGLNFRDRIERLKNITRADTVDYYQRTHTWNNLRFYLGGDFPDKGEAVVQQIRRKLERLPKGERNQPEFPVGKAFKPLAERREIDQIYYQANWSHPALPEELWPAASILRAVLGEGWGSRIFGQARDRGLIYGINAYTSFDPGSSDIGISGYVTKQNIEELFRLVSREVADAAGGGLTEKEVEAAKNLRIGNRVRATQTLGQLLGWYMSNYEEDESIERFEAWNDKLRAVTVREVSEVASRLAAGGNFGAAFVGNVTENEAEEYSGLLTSKTAH